MSILARTDLFFSVGSYGWSESYYRTLSDGTDLSTLDQDTFRLSRLRAVLCGGGVFVDYSRTSNIAVRRDADDIEIGLYVTSSQAPLPGGLATTQAIPAVVDDIALLPNVAMVARLEAASLFYRGTHFLSGLPRGLVTQDRQYNRIAQWQQAFNAWASFLISKQYQIAVLSRTAPNQDRPVSTFSNSGNSVVLAGDTVGLNVGDTVRVMYLRKVAAGDKSGFLRRIATIDAVTKTITFSPTLETGAYGINGPKTLLHRQETILVNIANAAAEYVSHRNRGRPSRSPRGRRRRAA